jgi:hypothetical protein
MTIVRIYGAPVLAVLPEHGRLAERFAEDKLATRPYRLGWEAAKNYARSLIDGALSEFYVSRLLGLPDPDLDVHDGNHGADIGRFQVKSYDHDRYAPERRSFVFYPEALRRTPEGNPILGVAWRQGVSGREHRLRWCFSYGDAKRLAREPFTSTGRSRGALAVYEEDLSSYVDRAPSFTDWTLKL